ncbi:solute-binding protein [Actinocrispum wychmicini]|uniref:Extracellular solute-binding protein n=1 Tax=Actinocrispum wychmicini TaxID=1213861 RepID=A0A4V2S676_9PSEU|nr:solute-binding protein [Actinocrispum wychmicini]TCO54980.1 extracellular solute-binding protein [Actinocrispum wychmicini]
MKRRLSIALAVVLLVAVVVVIVLDRSDGASTPATQRVRGVIGSEKVAFFRDQRVIDSFAKHGLTVEVDSAGSRQIATTVDLAKYDFVFPSSSPAAQKIQRDRKITTAYTPFQSPMAVATFEPIVNLLTANGVVHNGVLDVGKYLAMAKAGTRWDQLPNNTAFPARKNVLVTTTDPRDSNSAAMYLAITSFVANGNNVVSTQDAEARLLPELTRLFLGQGYTEGSTDGPFGDYLATGMGKTPIVLIYESQFLDRQIRADGSIRPDMRMLYLSPTVYSKHTLLPLKPAGDQVGQLLTTDPELSRLAATFGFRTNDPRVFGQTVADHQLTVPADLVDVIEPPSYETLERMLDVIGQQYR